MVNKLSFVRSCTVWICFCWWSFVLCYIWHKIGPSQDPWSEHRQASSRTTFLFFLFPYFWHAAMTENIQLQFDLFWLQALIKVSKILSVYLHPLMQLMIFSVERCIMHNCTYSQGCNKPILGLSCIAIQYSSCNVSGTFGTLFKPYPSTHWQLAHTGVCKAAQKPLTDAACSLSDFSSIAQISQIADGGRNALFVIIILSWS